MMWFNLHQRAAMFGIDARIALVAMGVIATSIGVISINHIDEGKVYLAEKRLSDFQRSIFSNWASEGPTAMYTPDNIFANFASEYGDRVLGQDPWGNNYIFNQVAAAKTIDGQSVTIYLYTLHTAGPDEVDDSFSITTEADYNTWSPLNDDIGLKFSSYDITRKALADARRRLNEITTRLQIYERQVFETVRAFCDIPANQLSTTCDFNGNSLYTTDEEFKMNFLPRSTGENIATKYYDPGTTFTSGDITGMTNLMNVIGLNGYGYHLDKMRRVLRYTSNANGAAEAPFAARVWYQ